MLIPESAYVYLNLGIIGLYLALIIFGYIKGFLYEIVSLFYTGVAILISFLVSPVLGELFPLISIEKLYPNASFITNFVNINKYINTIIYFIIVFLVLKVLQIFLNLVLKFLNKIPVLGSVNKILGAGCGIINATLIILALSTLLSMPLFKNGAEVKENTLFKYSDELSEKSIELLNNALANKTDFKGLDLNNTREEFKKWLENYNE